MHKLSVSHFLSLVRFFSSSQRLSCIVSAPRVIMDEIRKYGCIIQFCNTQTKGEWQLFSLPVTYSTKALTAVSMCVLCVYVCPFFFFFYVCLLMLLIYYLFMFIIAQLLGILDFGKK